MIFQFLKSLDSFAVEYVPSINLKEKSKKSSPGGLVTLIVYSVSLAYFIYIITEWFSGHILPKTTSIMTAQNYSQYIDHSNENHLVEFCYWRYSLDLIDPFRETNNILMPIAFHFNNGIPSQPVSLIGNNGKSDYQSALITIDNMILIQNSNFQKGSPNKTEILIAIIKCDPKLLKQNQSCATDQEIEDFFDIGVNYLSFWVNLQQFDPLSSILKKVRKQIYFPFTKQLAQQGQLIFQQTKATIDSGFLFGSSSENEYVNNIQLIQTATEIEFWAKFLKYNTYFNLFLRLDPIRTEVQVTYVKLGEIMAQVGSIISILLMVKHLMIIYNEYLLENQMINDVLKIYFPKLDTLSDEDKNIIINQFNSVAKQKLLVTNIIYEISRLQFFIQTKFPLDGRDLLVDTHRMGINNEQEILLVKSLDHDRALSMTHFRNDDIKLLISNQEKLDKNRAKVHNAKSY